MNLPSFFQSGAARPIPFRWAPEGARQRWVAALGLLCVVVLTLQAWNFRYLMNPDGISYLDIADRLLQGDFRALAHPYWSPLYPSLLAIALKVFSPSPEVEFPVVHLVNWCIGMAALASFTFFLSQWLRRRGTGPMAGFRFRTGFAYALFLWGTSEMTGLAAVTPDLCVAALAYVAAGLCCRLSVAQPSGWGGWGTPVLLGMVLGLAYAAKAAMLPLGVALLVLLAIPWFFTLPRRSSLIIATLFFLITVLPLVSVLSRQQHRLTFGESGRLNYGWYVQGIPLFVGWTDQAQTDGPPAHPPRVINRQPMVREFKDPVPGTYPLWYDPVFWHEGLRVRFDLRKQISALAEPLGSLLEAHGRNLVPLLAGLCVLCLLAGRRRLRAGLSDSWLILWPLIAFGMYSLVHLEARYIAPFVVLFWFAIYDAASPGRLRLAQRAVFAVIALCICLPLLKQAAVGAIRPSKPSADIAVSRELARLGLRPGDGIVITGTGFRASYARLARLRIVAEIPEAGQLWALNDAGFDALREKLRAAGPKAIVGQGDCALIASKQWRSIADTGYCVRLLD